MAIPWRRTTSGCSHSRKLYVQLFRTQVWVCEDCGKIGSDGKAE